MSESSRSEDAEGEAVLSDGASLALRARFPEGKVPWEDPNFPEE